jgi:glycosyltransferase involved in cell wall biosynthesis
MKNLRLLWLGDYGKGTNTGFATVNKNIIPWLKKLYGNTPRKHENEVLPLEIDVCAVNYFGEMYDEGDGVTVFSAKRSEPPDYTKTIAKGTSDDFGRIGFMKILQDSIGREINGQPTDAYNGIFILQDPGIISPLVPGLKMIKDDKRSKNLKNFKSILYCPLDHSSLEVIKILCKGLEFFDCVVTYNEFSRRLMLEANPALQGKLKVVPHGVDLQAFYPLSQNEKDDLRDQYFKHAAGKFIICNVNRNQHRKDIPVTVFAFQEYKRRNPDAFLYLHMNPQDPMGWDLRGLLLQTGLKEFDDFMLPPRELQNHDFTTRQLNEIYNACDVFVTTTTGEGWGLTVTEAMACKLPVICPLNTSFHEITDNGKRAYVLQNLYPSCNTVDNTIRQQCDYLEVADMLEQVHYNLRNNRAEHTEKTEAAYRYVQTLDWQTISRRWFEIFKEVY